MRQRNIYILLTDTGTWFSRMIKCYTKAPYNHASISLDENLEELYSFGRKVYYNPLSAGFVKEGVDRGVFLYKKNTKCIIYKMVVSELQYDIILKSIAQFKYFEDQYRYNLLGVMGIAMNKRIIRKNAFTCSQFVASVLVASGIHVFEKYIELITPNDITKIPQLQLIYEGKLRDYHQAKTAIYNPDLFDWNQYKANF
ncbi:hypothetical protein JMM81_20375 [Bacillus sp. V3B]|uniref:hypothetical protein n=1 Tax=Bacillus sp. V3B TaxID=2804915 RepID=UPI00210D446C|nr:hypothetical protein [Bacillus sp. V3B]MCQ6277234.1 hypothetical protein [Bacillus sp. V3B]